MDALRDALRAQTRWPVLDGVRGLAVMCVVGYHALRLLVVGDAGPSSYSAWWWPAMTGRLALDAFFVLSGFLIAESWRAARRRLDLWSACKQYGRRRLLRILPAYYVSLLILVPLVAPHLLRSPGDLALLAAVQQYLQPGLPSEVNVVYWSLTTEIHFYLLAPLVVAAIARLGPARVVTACLGVAIAWQMVTPAGLPPSLLLGRIDQFVIGAALAAVLGRSRGAADHALVRLTRRDGVGIGLLAAVVGCGVWQGALLGGHVEASAPLLHPVTGIVLAAGVCRLLGRETRSRLEHPALRAAGIVSYGVYLCHFPLLEHGYRLVGVSPAHPGPVALAIGATAVLVAASFAVGAASYVFVESRFQARATTTSSARDPRVEAPATRTLPAWPLNTATSTSSSARPA